MASMFRPHTPMLVFLGLSALACGPGDQTAGDQGSTSGGSNGDRLCTAECDLEERCPDPAVVSAGRATCLASCRGHLGTAPVYRTDVIAKIAECYDQLPCDGNDDLCGNEAVLLVSSDPANDPSVQACLSYQDACSSAGASYSQEVRLAAGQFDAVNWSRVEIPDFPRFHALDRFHSPN